MRGTRVIYGLETFDAFKGPLLSLSHHNGRGCVKDASSGAHPLTPAQQLVGWTKYILQMGSSGHLKLHAFQQLWYEQYLLGILLFLLVVTLGTVWLCGKLLGLVARWLCGARKLKEA